MCNHPPRQRFLSFALLLLVWLTFKPLKSQFYISEHILINEGLSNNFVHDMVLDSKGRLWVATESGLNSYNGISFTSYNVSNSVLGANMINCLWHETASDRVWVGTKGNGVSCVETDAGAITTCNASDSTLNNVLCITPAHDGRCLWLISPNDIMLLDPTSRQITPMELGQLDQYFRCGADDGNGNLIIGSHMHGASVLNVSTMRLTPLVFDGTQIPLINVNEILKDHHGRIWLATNVGLWFYQPGSQHLMPYANVSNTEVYNLVEIDQRYLWINTSQGNLALDLETDQISPVRIDGEIPLFDNILSLYQDPHGNIWIGGNGSGIEFVSHTKPSFRKFHDDPIWGIYAEGDTTWVGTRNHVQGFIGTRCVRDIDLSVSGADYGIVISINGNGSDLLYLAVHNHCLALDKRTGRISDITTANGQPIDAITFYREEDGTFWITTTDGIYTLHNGYAEECLPINTVLNKQSFHGIRRDKQGNLWVATYENGIYLFDSSFRLLRNLSQQTGFFSNSIQHLKFDSHDRLWMSTPDGPCCIPDTNHPEQYVTYGYPDGLQDTYVRAIQEDRKGNIWMSTNNGISMLDMTDRTFVNYSQADYMPVNNMNGGAIMQPDGGLVFTSMDGLCICYPDSLISRPQTADVRLLSFEVLEADELQLTSRTILPDDHGVYHLEPDQNSFRLYFGTTDYAQSRLMEYEYQTDERPHSWTRCSRSIVTFRNLRPSSYNIRVRSRMKGQSWADSNMLHLQIVIHQPWWWTLWARFFYLLLVATVIWTAIRHYMKRMRLTSQLELERRKNLVEHEHNAERLQFFTNITHELKTPLTLIQAPLEELLQDEQLPPAHQKRIKLVYDSSLRLTELCNKLLDFRKAQMHSQHLKVTYGNLGQLVHEVGESFTELNTNPELQILVEVQQPQQDMLFDADVIRSILTNLLSNAQKYTPKGTIRLLQRQIEVEGGKFLAQLVVSDTGYGIPASALPHIFDRYYQVSGAHQASGTGIGLSIVRSMVELHKAQIKAESQEGKGSTFTITFDVNQTYPEAEHLQEALPAANTKAAISTGTGPEADDCPTLLLVEDDQQILDFMAESLSGDYRILTAHNGKEGLKLAFEHTPDVVITDLMMPVMNGNILCRTLKEDLRTSHIPVIMLTAKDTPDDQLQGFTDGADIYLTKPFSLKMLRARLQNIMQARLRMVEWLNAQAISLQTPQALQTPQTSQNPQAPQTPQTSQPPQTLQTPPPHLSLCDQNFLRDVRAYIIEHITDDNLRMEHIAQPLHISHSTLYRKLKALTGLSGAEFIRKVRVLHSAELLRSGHCNISEAAYSCGFCNMAYFRTAFKEVFGVTPSEYLKQ